MTEKTEIYDVVTIGAGPSALAAAIYTTREDLKTVLLEKGVVGGLMAITDKVDNYPGFPDGVEGLLLAEDFQKQAERFGAQIQFGEVTGLKRDDQTNLIQIQTTDGDLTARAVLIATGADYKKIGIKGEQEFYARGVHYCATCDGAFYRGKRLAVIGGGNSAVQEAMYLTRFAEHIDLTVRSWVKASDVLKKELNEFVEQGKITVHEGWTPDEVVADKSGQVIALKGHDTKTDEPREIACDGVFIFAGLVPNTAFLSDTAIEFDGQGLIKVDQDLMTNIPGVFASGDVRSGATMQVASAAGDGATAALKMREYLEKQKQAELEK
jgi:thioredoxin reductase (NADPH)